LTALGTACLCLGGCAELVPRPLEPSKAHLRAEPRDAATEPEAAIPQVVERLPIVPVPEPTAPQERYTVVVNEVDVRELLFALARDAAVNVDVHPGIKGIVTLNAVDQTLPQILSRIAEQVSVRYADRAGTIAVMPDEPFFRRYTVDYVNLSRDVENTVNVQTEIDTAGAGDALQQAGGGGGGGGGGGAGGGGGGGGNLNNSRTRITSLSNQRFWQTLANNVAAIVGELVVIAPQPGIMPTYKNVIANPETGVLTVRADSRQHREIQALVDAVTTSAQRQVLIEATVVEVTLTDRYRAGIDWGRVAATTGLTVTQRLIGGAVLGDDPLRAEPSAFIARYTGRDTAIGDVDATLQLLQEFGNVQVLSSPKIMVLNNQTAVLKVVENQVYFAVDADTTVSQVGVALTTFTTTARTVPVGFVMTVTPGIHANANVIMNVRPSISSIAGAVNDPNPALAQANVINAIPVIRTREMESLLKVGSGQTAVLGGLMQDRNAVDTRGVPWLADLPGVGELFKQRNNRATKSELVIFLRPTVIRNPDIERDLAPQRHHLEDRPFDNDLAPPLSRGRAEAGSVVSPAVALGAGERP